MVMGVPAGMLFVLSEHILTPSSSRPFTQRAAWLALLLTVLATVPRWIGIGRDRPNKPVTRAWSFIHRQVVKVLWLLMGLATLTTFAMFLWRRLYGVCGVAGVSASACICTGCFSEELLEWAGC